VEIASPFPSLSLAFTFHRYNGSVTLKHVINVQWNLGSRTPVHEQFGSRTNFPSKIVSDDERCLGLRTRKLATAVGDKLRVSARECQLLVNFGSVHIPA
jgi:hypothetical protein